MVNIVKAQVTDHRLRFGATRRTQALFRHYFPRDDVEIKKPLRTLGNQYSTRIDVPFVRPFIELRVVTVMTG
jgi:hypothetical protein